MDSFQDIAQLIADGTADRQKTKTIHFQALINADRIASAGIAQFCNAVNIEPSWELEVRKMLDLSVQLRIHGYKLSKS